MKQNISTEATLVLLNTLLNEAGVSARQQYEKILPGRSLGQNRSGEAKANRRDAFRFRTARVPGMPADFIQRQEAVRSTVVSDDSLAAVFAKIAELLRIVGVIAVKAKLDSTDSRGPRR